MPTWPVHMKCVWALDQLVFALRVRWLWKPLKLPKQHPHWYNSAKRCWITCPASNLWDCSGTARYSREYGNEIANEFARQGTVHWFAGPELALGVSRAAYKKKGKMLDGEKAWQREGVLSVLGRQAPKLISGSSPTAKTRLLSFNTNNLWLLLASLLDITLWEDTPT